MKKKGSFVSFVIDNKKKAFKARAVFFPTNKLPLLPITTPLTFPVLNSKVVLALDKSGWWNPLGGHIESGETWEQALKRESMEEAGAEIDFIRVVGYIKVTTIEPARNSPYPPISIIPVTTSRVLNYSNTWMPMETSERRVVDCDEAIALFKQRDDGGQMLQIFEHLLLVTQDLFNV